MEEIKQMQKEGKSDLEISNVMKRKGFSDRDIVDIFAQAKIKEAVTSPTTSAATPSQFPDENQLTSMGNVNEPQATFPETPSPEMEPPTEYSYQTQAEYAGMQPSMLGQEQQAGAYPPEQQIIQQGYETYPAQEPGASYGYDAYSQYQPYQETISSDIITEISEQVVADKLSTIQDKLEKAIDFKTIADAKITSLNERLKRIEQILDKLQLAILQKVGDYVTDVGDIKREMRENQESFKALLPKLREIHESKHPAHQAHSMHQHLKGKHKAQP